MKPEPVVCITKEPKPYRWNECTPFFWRSKLGVRVPLVGLCEKHNALRVFMEHNPETESVVYNVGGR